MQSRGHYETEAVCYIIIGYKLEMKDNLDIC